MQVKRDVDTADIEGWQDHRPQQVPASRVPKRSSDVKRALSTRDHIIHQQVEALAGLYQVLDASGDGEHQSALWRKRWSVARHRIKQIKQDNELSSSDGVPRAVIAQ